MGVQLNIKDQETVELARDLARQMGRSVTETIRDALKEKKANRERMVEEKMKELAVILDGIEDLWSPAARNMTSQELMDSIYDEHGLPI